jgi:hypothetical protein
LSKPEKTFAYKESRWSKIRRSFVEFKYHVFQRLRLLDEKYLINQKLHSIFILIFDTAITGVLIYIAIIPFSTQKWYYFLSYGLLSALSLYYFEKIVRIIRGKEDKK